MKISSPNFKHRGRIPARHAFRKGNSSPALTWSDLPDGTRELALVCDDPDAPGKTWVHWVIWGIPADSKGLKAGVPKDVQLNDPKGARQGRNDFGLIGYDGPAPPPGKDHRYIFRLYALSEAVILGPTGTAADLRRAMEGKILEEAEVVGIYST